MDGIALSTFVHTDPFSFPSPEKGMPPIFSSKEYLAMLLEVSGNSGIIG